MNHFQVRHWNTQRKFISLLYSILRANNIVLHPEERKFIKTSIASAQRTLCNITAGKYLTVGDVVGTNAVIKFWENTKVDRTFKWTPSSKRPDFYTDFITLRWVKYTERLPDNGICYAQVRFNGKNTGEGRFINGVLNNLEGLSSEEFSEYEDTFYWLEEIIDSEGYAKAEAKIEEYAQLKCRMKSPNFKKFYEI